MKWIYPLLKNRLQIQFALLAEVMGLPASVGFLHQFNWEADP